MTKLLKIFLLGFLAFGFVACDEVSEVVDSASKAVDTATKEGKKLAKALSIEQPLLGVEFDDDYNQYLYIQSQDNNTIIEDIIINRGNCGVIKYATDGDMAKAYEELNGNRLLKTKSGQSVVMKDYIWSKQLDFYNSLDADSKAIYKPNFPVKLAYGKKFRVPNKVKVWNLFAGVQMLQDCDINDIIEVEVVVNGGGSIIYKPKELMLF